jgi:hypothetical protein
MFTTPSSTVNTTAPANSKGSHGVPPGAIAGIAIGSTAIVVVIAAVIFTLASRHARRRQAERRNTSSSQFSKAELPADHMKTPKELSSENKVRYELAEQRALHELD